MLLTERAKQQIRTASRTSSYRTDTLLLAGLYFLKRTCPLITGSDFNEASMSCFDYLKKKKNKQFLASVPKKKKKALYLATVSLAFG